MLVQEQQGGVKGLRCFHGDDEQKKQLGIGSGAIRALSRTKVLLIAADLAAAALCKEFLAARLRARKITVQAERWERWGSALDSLFPPIGWPLEGHHLVLVGLAYLATCLRRLIIDDYPSTAVSFWELELMTSH